MARADLLISLVKAGASGDREGLRATVEALAAEERAKSHHILADRLQRALANGVTVANSALSRNGRGHDVGRDIILETTPRIRLEQLILPLPAREQGQQLIEEHIRADTLRAHGMEPRHRVLLSGPPGNGKTSFAEAVAEGLGVPFYVVRYDALVGSYLGETNTRLRALFDYVRTVPCVLFFDEFDAIGKERGDTHETGEIKRVVSFLLMQLDRLPSYVVVVAASNHAELLDRAVWRRFQLRLSFPQPDENTLALYLERLIVDWPQKPKTSARALARKLGRVSFAEALDFCQSVRRRQILSFGEEHIDEIINRELEFWRMRVIPDKLYAAGSDESTVSPRSRRGTAQKRKK